MTAPVFVDTNVLVYARDASHPAKQQRAYAWMAHLWRDEAGRLSTQVLNEYYVTVTRKLDPGMSIAAARSDVRNLMAWQPLPLTTAVIERAWAVEDRFSVSHWDALVVGAAQVGGCDLLLTEDLGDGQVFDGVRVVDPFANQPERVL